jgi:AcrR family transcriptional regulator
MERWVKFSDYLVRRTDDDVPRNRGERTRARLLVAAALELEAGGFHAMRLADINRRADVAAGTFYIYFKNKTQITIEVLSLFMKTMNEMQRSPGHRGDTFASIVFANMFYIDVYQKDAGLLKCLWQLRDEVPELSKVWHEGQCEWAKQVVKGIDRRLDRPVDESTKLIVAYALGGMCDQLFYHLHISHDPYLAPVVPSPEYLAETLAVLWYRALFVADPNSESLSAAFPVLDLRLTREPPWQTEDYRVGQGKRS